MSSAERTHLNHFHEGRCQRLRIEKISFSQELKRQIVIRQLIDLGVHEYQGQAVYDLDYYTLRYLLTKEKAVQS
jgi:hypothetical protein